MSWTFWVLPASVAVSIAYVGFAAWRKNSQYIEANDVPNCEPAPLGEALARAVVSQSDPRAAKLAAVSIKAKERQEFAEADWEALCLSILGHEPCGCYDCDALGEVAFDGADPAEVLRTIETRRRAGETT